MKAGSGWCLSHRSALKENFFSPGNYWKMSVWEWQKQRLVVCGENPSSQPGLRTWGEVCRAGPEPDWLLHHCALHARQPLGCLQERNVSPQERSHSLCVSAVPRSSCFFSSVFFQIAVVLRNPPDFAEGSKAFFCLFFFFSFFNLGGLFVYLFISAQGVDLLVFIGFVVGWWGLFCNQNF